MHRKTCISTQEKERDAAVDAKCAFTRGNQVWNCGIGSHSGDPFPWAEIANKYGCWRSMIAFSAGKGD